MNLVIRLWGVTMAVCFGVAYLWVSYILFTDRLLHDGSDALSRIFYLEGVMTLGIGTAALFVAWRIAKGDESL